MVCLNYCLSINKLSIVASTVPNTTSSSSSSPSIPHQARPSDPSHPTVNTANTPVTSQPPSLPKLKKKRKQKQPSILEIERAIGAGIFRDRDPIRESEEKKSMFDTIFSTEGSVEKQLRETGEWITDKTEGTFRSAGKPILMFAFQWMLPLWLLAFCVASGIIRLPFHSPWIDDLIM